MDLSGLAECLVVLTGKHHGESKDAEDLGIEIINEMNNLVNEFSLKYNLNFALINSKDFGGRFIERDRLEYGLISKVTDGDYYTNGSNIPKHYECDLAHKAKVEAPYHRLCLAGNSYLVNTKETLEENRQIIDLLDKYDLGCMCFKE